MTISVVRCDVLTNNNETQSGTVWFNDHKMYGFRKHHYTVTFYLNRKRCGCNETIHRTLPKREIALLEYLSTWDGTLHVVLVI